MSEHKRHVKMGASNSEMAGQVAEFDNCEQEWQKKNFLEIERDEKKD